MIKRFNIFEEATNNMKDLNIYDNSELLINKIMDFLLEVYPSHEKLVESKHQINLVYSTENVTFIKIHFYIVKNDDFYFFEYDDEYTDVCDYIFRESSEYVKTSIDTRISDKYMRILYDIEKEDINKINFSKKGLKEFKTERKFGL